MSADAPTDAEMAEMQARVSAAANEWADDVEETLPWLPPDADGPRAWDYVEHHEVAEATPAQLTDLGARIAAGLGEPHPGAPLAEAPYTERLHPRDRLGKWQEKLGVPVPARVARAEAVTPKAWIAPPPPVGKKGETRGGRGYSSDEAYGTNTALGQAGEEAFARIIGGTIIHPPGKGAQSPLDVVYNGYAFEVKAASTKALEYKATPKRFEIEEKEAFARELGVKGALAIVVMDSDAGEAHAYYRDGLGTGRLSERRGWKYLGSARISREGGARGG